VKRAAAASVEAATDNEDSEKSDESRLNPARYTAARTPMTITYETVRETIRSIS
jgi:hypothetical protein